MKINDSFYTPSVLAEKLISYAVSKKFDTVADFCVGDGELLRAARMMWPDIACFGSDICNNAILKTKQVHPDWQLDQINFLDNSSRQCSSALSKNPVFDLILLNPPFSCRGGTIHRVEYDQDTFFVSTAMRFLVTALQYLDVNGAMYAILPTSVAYSQKDRRLWELLEKKHNLSILEEPNVQYFKGCAPNVILVSLNDFSRTSNYKSIARLPLDLKDLMVFRGKVSMDKLGLIGQGKHLVHSTNIRNNRLTGLNIKLENQRSEIEGPAILLPRVGKPDPTKVCLISKDESYVLSDCIIAIKISAFKEAQSLYKYILDNWSLIEQLYKGTGARYITIYKLSCFLNLDIEGIYNYEAQKAI
jgi:predicted RNA methylase